MGPGIWGLERSSGRDSMDNLNWAARVGDVGDGEDHVAGLVERIAQTMLEEEDEEAQHASCWGGSPSPLLQAQSAAQVCASNWDKRRVESVKALSGLPELVQNRIESEAMELLYTELVRLKMEELAAAQQQLSFYQNAFVDSRQSSRSGYTSAGLSNMSTRSTVVEQHGLPSAFYYKPLHRHSAGGDWSAPHTIQCQENGRSHGQRLTAPLMHPNPRYLTRTTVVGVPALRESGGTGVFLPRCRTGARNLRSHDSRRKSDFKFPASAARPDTFLPDKVKENMADRSSLQYPSCSPLQEVAPDISLPTEWTY